MQISPKTLDNPGFKQGFSHAVKSIPYAFKHPTLMIYMLIALVINGIVIGLLIWWGISSLDFIGDWLKGQAIAEVKVELSADEYDEFTNEYPLAKDALSKHKSENDKIIFIVSDYEKLLESDGAFDMVWDNAEFEGFWSASLRYVAYYLDFIFIGLQIFIIILLLLFVVPTVYTITLNLNPVTLIVQMKLYSKVTKQEIGRELPSTDNIFVEIMKSIFAEIVKLFFFLFFSLLALLLNIIPVIGQILSPIVLFFVSSNYTGWSLVTPYYESLGYGYKLQRTAMRRQRSSLLGLGMAFELCMLVPILNLLILFLGPIGGALLVSKMYAAGSTAS
jgi:uncharacterized protein involved in cysteine biosynthesis